MLALLLLISCEDNGTTNKNDLEGTYQGIFYRNSASEDFDTANVTIEFSSDTWEGASNITHYPALCHGSYSIKADSIYFENECAWTADFDWSFILDGTYYFQNMDDTITFQRKYGSDTTANYSDNYLLIKQ